MNVSVLCCHIIILDLTYIDNNATLLAAVGAEAQMSVSRKTVSTETQKIPLSVQGEPQTSKYVITVVCSNAHIHRVVMDGINNGGIVFLIA